MNRNLDGTVAETIGVSLIAKGKAGGIRDTETTTMTLTETDVNTGIFRGSIGFVYESFPMSENGIVEMNIFGDAELTYTDAYDPADIKKDTVPLNL